MSPREQHGARAAAPGRRDPAQAAPQSKHDPRIATVILIALGGCLVATAAVSLRGLIHALDYHQVVSAIHATSPYALLLAIAATLASYAALIGYDISGLHYAGARLRLPIASLASFCAYAIGNVIG